MPPPDVCLAPGGFCFSLLLGLLDRDTISSKALIDPDVLIKVEADAMCPGADELGMFPHRYIVNVEAAVVKDGRYLMVVRGERESHARGVLTMPGGKVEHAGSTDNILEETLRREIEEEVGVQIYPDIGYVESKAFITDGGQPVVDVVFLCRYESGTPIIGAPGEVAAIHWMTAQEVIEHPKTPPWTRQSIELAEEQRLARQW